MVPKAAACHHFAINRPLRGVGPNTDGSAIFICAECKWRFAVHGRLIAALDQENQPINGYEGLRRIATFADGPCPSAVEQRRNP